MQRRTSMGKSYRMDVDSEIRAVTRGVWDVAQPQSSSSHGLFQTSINTYFVYYSF